MVRIESVSFGEIKVNGKTYYSDMIIWWDGHTEYRDKTHVVGVEEMAKFVLEKPEAIVIGTGMDGTLRVTERAQEMAEQEGVDVFKETSEKAVDIFNGLIADGKMVVALIHTTC